MLRLTIFHKKFCRWTTRHIWYPEASMNSLLGWNTCHYTVIAHHMYKSFFFLISKKMHLVQFFISHTCVQQHIAIKLFSFSSLQIFRVLCTYYRLMSWKILLSSQLIYANDNKAGSCYQQGNFRKPSIAGCMERQAVTSCHKYSYWPNTISSTTRISDKVYLASHQGLGVFVACGIKFM